MFKDTLVLNLNKNVLKRFEPNLNGGTVFLFDMERETFWSGNISVDYLIRLINGKKRLGEIYEELFNIFEDYTQEELINSYNSIIKSLIEKGFLEIINHA